MDRPASTYERYLQDLAEEGRRLEELQLSTRQIMLNTLSVLAVLIMPALWWCWTDISAGRFPLGGGIALLILALLAPLASAGLKQASWQRERRVLYAHMRERVFGRGELESYLRGQAGGGNPGEAAPQDISGYIDFFTASSNLRGQGYRYLGRREESPQLVRALLMQLLAAELLQGISLFSDDEADLMIVRELPPELVRQGWQPPSEAELNVLLARVLGAGAESSQANGILAGFVVVIPVLLSGYMYMDDSVFVDSLLWLLPLALALAAITYLIVQRIPQERPRRRVTARWQEFEWDIFHNGLLRDYIALNRGKHWEAQLRGFSRSYAHSRPEAQDDVMLAARMELDVIEIVLQGLLTRLRESPQEFEEW